MRFQRLTLLLNKLWTSGRQEGIAATARKAIRLTSSVQPDPFDIRYGVDTSGEEPLWRLTIDSENVRFDYRYQVTSEDELAEALAMIPRPFGEFMFINLGCGKGRSLIIAAQNGFGDVMGVEFAQELVVTARQNMKRLNLPGAIIHLDASEFVFPARNLVVFMYNPFGKEVMSKVLQNLSSSLNGEVYIIYKNPVCANLLDKSGWLTPLGSPYGRNIRLWKAESKQKENKN